MQWYLLAKDGIKFCDWFSWIVMKVICVFIIYSGIVLWFSQYLSSAIDWDHQSLLFVTSMTTCTYAQLTDCRYIWIFFLAIWYNTTLFALIFVILFDAFFRWSVSLARKIVLTRSFVINNAMDLTVAANKMQVIITFKELDLS